MKEQEASQKAVTSKTQGIVYALLMGLLLITVGLAYLPLGWLNIAAAFAIALLKALLVVWFFMHLRETERLIAVFFLASLFMLAVSAILAFTDYLTR